MILTKLERLINRNKYSIGNIRSVPKRVNLEWWQSRPNVGDEISPVIVDWMLEKKNLTREQEIRSTKHLMAVGSIIGMSKFDATIWGSGIHVESSIKRLKRFRPLIKYDIRALRGPVTKQILEGLGYNCKNAVYGDPAVLMPLIYPGCKDRNRKGTLVIDHYYNDSSSGFPDKDIKVISAGVEDWKGFIDEILMSEKVISSSLHGIILAEAYGVPAVFVSKGMDQQMMKYKDWYQSTGRDDYPIAASVEEALSMKACALPDIKEMQHHLIDAFPYDLWSIEK